MKRQRVVFSLRIDPELNQELDAFADRHQLSKTWLVQRFIRKSLPRYRSKSDTYIVSDLMADENNKEGAPV